MCIGHCPKCEQRTKLTRHHILVRRYFGSPDNAPILLICRTCHTELHKLIPDELKTIHFYWEVVFMFLSANRIKVMEWSGNRSYIVRRYENRPDNLQPMPSEVRQTG